MRKKQRTLSRKEDIVDIDAFISYSHKDKPFAEKLQTRLEAENIVAWMDKHIPDGRPLRSEIDQKLESAALVILIISPDSMTSRNVTYEWSRAIFELQKETYPIHLRECNQDSVWFKYLWSNIGIKIPSPLPQLQDMNSEINELDKIASDIKERLKGLYPIREAGKTLDDPDATSEAKRKAAHTLARAQDFKSVATDCLLKAIEHQFKYGYGPTQIEIANALSEIGDTRCIPSLVRLFIDGGEDAGEAIIRALTELNKR
jgi:hypothetical protein